MINLSEPVNKTDDKKTDDKEKIKKNDQLVNKTDDKK